MVWSSEQESSCEPSRENWTRCTQLRWPLQSAIFLLASRSHSWNTNIYLSLLLVVVLLRIFFTYLHTQFWILYKKKGDIKYIVRYLNSIVWKCNGQQVTGGAGVTVLNCAHSIGPDFKQHVWCLYIKDLRNNKRQTTNQHLLSHQHVQKLLRLYK